MSNITSAGKGQRLLDYGYLQQNKHITEFGATPPTPPFVTYLFNKILGAFITTDL